MPRDVLALTPREPDVTPQEFDAQEWARGHTALDEFRFKIIFRILAAAGMCLIGTAAWSLQAQYTAMQQSQAHFEAQLSEIRSLRTHVDAAVAPALSNAQQ